MPLLVAMRDGLMGAGIEVRVDHIGAEPFALSMLRVRCAGVSVEAAERWLLRAVNPSGVVCLLHQRWRDFGVWSGTLEEADVLTHQLKALPRRADDFFAGATHTTCSRELRDPPTAAATGAVAATNARLGNATAPHWLGARRVGRAHARGMAPQTMREANFVACWTRTAGSPTMPTVN